MRDKLVISGAKSRHVSDRTAEKPFLREQTIDLTLDYTTPLIFPESFFPLFYSVVSLVSLWIRSTKSAFKSKYAVKLKMEGTVFTPSLGAIKHVKTEQGEMLTKPFLELCKMILPVIDKFGAAMTLVKSDIGGNITRLENRYLSDPDKFKYLYTFIQVEIESKTAKGSSSCTNGLLWLTRAMDFLVELFRNLLTHSDWTMSQACSDSYQKTLKKWHGWLASSSFSVAMKLAPDRKKFMDVVSGSGDINSDMEKFCSEFGPLLQDNHKFLASVGLDDMKAS